MTSECKTQAEVRAEIVAAVTNHFSCFGGGRTKGADWNPIVAWTKDDPPTFAAGVSVDDVVRFVVEFGGKTATERHREECATCLAIAARKKEFEVDLIADNDVNRRREINAPESE